MLAEAMIAGSSSINSMGRNAPRAVKLLSGYSQRAQSGKGVQMAQRIATALLCLLLLTVALDSQFALAREEDKWAVSQYNEGPCKLRYLSSGPDQGLRLWFGEQLTLKCSFDVFTRSGYEGLTWIDVGGTAFCDNADSPRHYAHHVAFFDADHNLITCSRDFRPDEEIGATPRRSGHDLPLPTGYHSAIAHFKTAYYESDVAIGTRATRPPADDEASAGEHDRDEAPFKINPVQRPLFAKMPEGCYVYTRDGKCKVKPDPRPYRSSNPPMLLGDKSRSEATIYFTSKERKSVEVTYSIRNFAASKTYHDLYIAFFDDEGRLVATTSLDGLGIGPNASSPSVEIVSASEGVAVSDLRAFSKFVARVPLGEHERITSYKMTMYVYDKPRERAE
jgi:hypothetical protein